MYEKPKGTRDILPPDSAVWSKIEDAARKLAKAYNAHEVKTPAFEDTALFARSVGEGTDIVSKEMYTFQDKKGRSLTLRPEMTAGVARAFIEQGLFNSPMPVKLFYIANCFRYENVQAGRYREFRQFGMEIFGADDVTADFEAVTLATNFLAESGITNFKLVLNNIGCKACRAEYLQALKDFVKPNLDKLCKDCNNRYNKNPLRMLDCKEEFCGKLFNSAPKITDFLCDDCKQSFAEFQQLLKTAKIKFELDPRLVRGLDYYNKNVYEFVVENYSGNKSIAIGGGGRYDALIETLGGPKTSATGFGLGLDRIIGLLDGSADVLDIYVANVGTVVPWQTLPIVNSLREAGFCVEFNIANRPLKAQFKLAEKDGADFMLIVGEKELAANSVNIKNLKTGKEETVAIKDLNTKLTKKQK